MLAAVGWLPAQVLPPVEPDIIKFQAGHRIGWIRNTAENAADVVDVDVGHHQQVELASRFGKFRGLFLIALPVWFVPISIINCRPVRRTQIASP